MEHHLGPTTLTIHRPSNPPPVNVVFPNKFYVYRHVVYGGFDSEKRFNAAGPTPARNGPGFLEGADRNQPSRISRGSESLGRMLHCCTKVKSDLASNEDLDH